MQSETESGSLYIVATPIGNLNDMSLRAIEVLKKADRIVAEDTRHAAPLLKHFSIQKPVLSMHDFNESDRIGVILDYLYAGESIALISDAGTPLISDPGFQLVRKAKEEGLHVVPVPGPCAAIAALSVSGMPTDRFVFEGFLSAKQESKRNQLSALAQEKRTLIFYEAPHRLLATLEVMAEVFGAERRAVVARELTKIYESVLTASCGELIEYYTAHSDELKGEIVILLAGSQQEEKQKIEVLTENVLDILLEELPLKQAAALTSKITGERKNLLYDLALTKKK